MFTGIVEGTGTITDREEQDDGLRVQIESNLLGGLDRGDSVAVSGVCLTVEDHGEGWFETFLAAETRAVTYLGALGVGDAVNLERAMPADGRFDGHLVQGHVDGVTTVEAIESIGEDWRYTMALPDQRQYLVPKGSIALDGISLTIADIDVEAGTFDVAIIPETHELTTLSEKAPGDPLHVEYDVIAKYVAEMLESGQWGQLEG